MERTQPNADRMFSLDVLRGTAALSIVFWHWQHFFYTGTATGTFDATRLPLSGFASLFYTRGWLAVDLFFSLSGFIFYWLYSTRVSEGKITPGRFAWLRFSRLYPLHFATFLVVAAGQAWLLRATGTSFVYGFNDLRHFILNLFFASSWGFESGYSYNGPIWSVSVEVLLYAIFFACCRLFPVRPAVLAPISLAGFILGQRFHSPLGRGVGSFFLGGCMFFAYRALKDSRHAQRATRGITALVIIAWTATFLITALDLDVAAAVTGAVPSAWRVGTAVRWGLQKALPIATVTMLFPLTILSLALNEHRRGSLGRRISFLGDISYSSYLLHFPLQLVFYALAVRYALPHTLYYSTWFMALYFGVLVLLSLGSYRYFEMPVQRSLRRLSFFS